MEFSRRTFISSVAAGLAATYATTALAQRRGRGAPAAGAIPAPVPIPGGEDGAKLWLRYKALGPAAAPYAAAIKVITVESDSPTLKIIRDELIDAFHSLFGAPVAAGVGPNDNAVVVGTPKSSPLIAGLKLDADLAKQGDEGYIIRSLPIGGRPGIVIASNGELGALYGAFHLLRLVQTLQPITGLNIAEKPAMKIRMADHWDNMNGSIERGFAGRSIVFAADPVTKTPAWTEPNWKPNPRVAQYGLAAASIGMNGVCINNVNASAVMLNEENIKKTAMLADVLRPYGVRIYLSANFSAPVTLANMATADPTDASVQKWWRDTADMIYKLIPDFGGLLVKANSEGQPGPKTYNRTHAEGANCLAQAFAPHNGSVIWRAFVYDETVDPDRVKRAYIEFMALEGKFLPNVLIQIKNGPLDFQPREPFSPLFGALKQTSILAEIQPTQEYLGQAKHLVYLGTMWEEFLQSDTYAKGKGSTVAKVLDNQVYDYALTGIAGVLNPGLDANWTGHHFSQSNWYALGRLAWNGENSAKTIAEDWTRMTWSTDPAVVKTIVDIMMGSRETFLNYTMPLGLHHMIGGDHYAPQPWNGQAARPDWTATYYHHAGPDGIGFERTRKSDGKGGDDYVDQYAKPVADVFNSLETCPDKSLLWFHHLPWDYKMKSGQTLWKELCDHYSKGVKDAQAMMATWGTLEGKVDPQRHKEVMDRLKVQVADAGQWRTAILEYFAGFSKLPITD